MIWDALAAVLGPHGLFVMGIFEDGGKTRAILGANKDLWPQFKESIEYKDGRPDPMDRWSKRLIEPIARNFEASACYPSDGPPYLPFIAWAKATDRFWSSPTGMLVHDQAGLMISIRGAVVWDKLLARPETTALNPCASCGAPCISACPVGALSAETAYDVPLCKSHIEAKGEACLQGCLVRRACPVSQSFERDPAQSAFHMRAFMGA